MVRFSKSVLTSAVLMAWSSLVMAQGGATSSVENINRNLTGPEVVSPVSWEAVGSRLAKPLTQGEVKPGGPTIKINGFQFEGLTAFSVDDLLQASSARLPGVYDLFALQAISDAITAYYRKAGYLVARAWLTPQAIKDGVVVYQIYEGRLSQSEPIKVEANHPGIDVSQVKQIVKKSLCGEVDCGSSLLKQSSVDRAALLVTEITGYQIRAELVPGKELGTSTMAMQVDPRSGRSVTGSGGARKGVNAGLSVDNFGSKATGENRAQVRLTGQDALKTGDQMGLSYMTTNKKDIENYNVDYSFPIGHEGWRMGLASGKTNYTLGAGFGGFAGDAKNHGVNLSYPILRTGQGNIDWRVDIDRISLSDQSSLPEDRRLNSARMGLSGDFQDQVLNGLGARTSWLVGWAQSDLKYEDARDSTTVGSRDKYTARINRLQGLGGDGWYTSANVYGQRASGNLDAYGKLFLGGANAVRAYAGGEVGGDTAVVGQFAIGKVWASTMLDRNLMADVSVFYDRGWARLQQNPTSGVTDNTSVRAGWGVEAKVSQKGAFVLRAFWAKGLSGDSSVDNKEDRVGLSLSMAY